MSADERKVFFVNPAVDFLVIGGLSIFGAIAMTFLRGRSFNADAWAFALMWIVNWPHFAATSFRLYRSRASLAQYPATAFGVPLLVGGMAAAAMIWPERIAPAFVKLFTLWSPFHFSGQTLGLSLLYARRAGWTVGRLERAAFSGFIFATYLWLILVQETSVVPETFGAVRFARLGLPSWMATAALAALHVMGPVLLLIYARACSAQRRIIPPIVLLPAVAQYIWFIVGWNLPLFNVFVPLFHSLQYLLIAWAVQLKERMDERGATPSAGFVLKESVLWGLLNVALGAVLFWALPRGVALLGVPLALTLPVLGAAVQIHHFFVDGVIWKLRNPKVGRPLEVTLDDLSKGVA